MAYYPSKMLLMSFNTAITRTVEALKPIALASSPRLISGKPYKAKIDVDFPKYRILGACNPALAFEALKLENKVGTMLPCNVVVRDAGGWHTEVAAIDPVASMEAIDNPALKQAAAQIKAKLEGVIAQL